MIQPSKHVPDQVVWPLARLQRVWADGGFALTIQVPPLTTPRPGNLLTRVAAQLSGFDAVLVAEAPDGAIALSSMALAVLFQRAGVSPMVQLSGRDRNRLALQSDILGLSALNIPSLLIDTRTLDRTSLGQNATARFVTDLNGSTLLATAARLRDEARFLSGASIKTPPVFTLGALIDLHAPPTVEQLEPAQFLVAAPADDPRSLPDLLSAFQRGRADFLRARPLLVSIPLIDAFAVEKAGGVQDHWQSCLAMLRFLQAFAFVRGSTIVVERLADLELLERGTGSGLFSSERPE